MEQIVIFNKVLFFGDADDFLTWSCAKKKEWIKKNTNQQNDEVIDQFIKTVCKEHLNGCGGCNNVASGVQQKASKANKARS